MKERLFNDVVIFTLDDAIANTIRQHCAEIKMIDQIPEAFVEYLRDLEMEKEEMRMNEEGV